MGSPEAETISPGEERHGQAVTGRQGAPRPGTWSFHHFSWFIPRQVMGGTQSIHPPVQHSRIGEGKKAGWKGRGHLLQRRLGCLPPRPFSAVSPLYPQDKPKQGEPWALPTSPLQDALQSSFCLLCFTCDIKIINISLYAGIMSYKCLLAYHQMFQNSVKHKLLKQQH